MNKISAGFLSLFLHSCLLVGQAPKLAVPLDGDLRVTAGRGVITVKGPHRFLEIAGKRGYHALSLNTRLMISADAYRGDEGTILLWVAPLESLSVVSQLESFLSKDPLALTYNLLSDA